MIETFIERLEHLLSEKKITQTVLANQVGLRRTTISEWKKNGSIPSADVALKIASYLGVSVEYLITGSDTSGFTPEERKMVSMYRTLSPTEQEAVDRVLWTFYIAATARAKEGKPEE